MPSELVSHALSSMLPVRMPATVQQALGAVTGLSQLQKLYGELADSACGPFLCSRLLEALQIRYRLSSEDRGQLPHSGATIVIANHPFGILDGAILSTLLVSVRSDVKILANSILKIPELALSLIPTDTRGGALSIAANVRGVREAHRHLSDGGLLLVFPAGEVAHLQARRRTIDDSPWSLLAARITASRSRHSHPTSIVPVHINGS